MIKIKFIKTGIDYQGIELNGVYYEISHAEASTIKLSIKIIKNTIKNRQK